MSNQTKKRRILRKLKAHNTIWHPESTLVFKSQKERVVIGRLVDDELVSLDKEAVELCTEWSFKPDETLLGQMSEESVNNDTEEDVNNESENNESENNESENEESENEETEEDVNNERSETPVNNERSETPVNNEPTTSNNEEIPKNFIVNFTEKLNKYLEVKDKKILELVQQNKDTETKFLELQNSYNKIMKKFETMKSLFT